MRPFVVVWPDALLFWIALVWAFLPELHFSFRSPALMTFQDAGSRRLILWGQLLAVVLAFFVALIDQSGDMFARRLWFWVGTMILVASSLLRRHCFRMLASSFTASVVV